MVRRLFAVTQRVRPTQEGTQHGILNSNFPRTGRKRGPPATWYASWSRSATPCRPTSPCSKWKPARPRWRFPVLEGGVIKAIHVKEGTRRPRSGRLVLTLDPSGAAAPQRSAAKPRPRAPAPKAAPAPAPIAAPAAAPAAGCPPLPVRSVPRRLPARRSRGGRHRGRRARSALHPPVRPRDWAWMSARFPAPAPAAVSPWTT
jgi:hypothetical protein